MSVSRVDASLAVSADPDERELRARALELFVYRHIHDESHPPEGEPAQHVSLDDICKRHPNVDALVIENHPEGINSKPLSAFKSLPFWPSKAGCDPRLAPPQVISGAESSVRIKDPTRKDAHQHVGIIGLSQEDQTALQKDLQARGEKFELIDGVLGPKLAAQVHAYGGLLVYNHPDWRPSERGLNYVLTQSEAHAVDAVEVANDLSFSGIDAGEVLAWTEKNFFQQGAFPAVVSGLDEHGPAFVTPTPTATVVVQPEGQRTANPVLDGIRKASTYLTRSRELALDMNVDGQHALGSRPTFAEGSQHHANVLLRHLPVGARVQVMINGRVAHEETVRLDQRAKKSHDVDVAVPFVADAFGDLGQGYMYVRVDSPKANSGKRSLLLATSAIPFDVVCAAP